MTDAEHAAVLRHLIGSLQVVTHEEVAAVERAIELLEREAQWVDDEGAAIAVERAGVLGASKIHRPLKDKYKPWPKADQ